MLDALNFLLADVRGALGPYLGVFLVTQIHWSQSEVGVVTMLGGLAGLAAQTPIGAAIDATRAKRGALVLALAVLAGAAVLIFAVPRLWAVAAANVAMASTLAGNLTLLGSVANLIVVQRAAVGGVAIGFWEYGRVGLPLGLLTLLFGTLWLMG